MKVMAGGFALAAFAVAILAGLQAGNSAAGILKGAIIAMLVSYPIGFLISRGTHLPAPLVAARERNGWSAECR
jgi:hypothetical protein